MYTNQKKLKKYFPLLFLAGALLFATCQTSDVREGRTAGTSFPEKPEGLGYEFTAREPVTTYPLPVSENYVNQTGKTRDGREINKYDRRENPVIHILAGFDKIWSMGDPEWVMGKANGSGPDDYSGERIVDPGIWSKNMAYVIKITGKDRTEAMALAAYLDDRRDQNYSMLSGLGPLQPWYIEGSGATTTVNHKLGDRGFSVLETITIKEEDTGSGAGSADSALGDFIKLMEVLRGPEGTTSPSKYFYTSPRPWRMNARGEVKQIGTSTLGDKTREEYETGVIVIPALDYVKETRGRRKDGGFPSGHTNAAYLSAFAYAYAIPERFTELIYRASELGENRIVAGMHSPLDVMGGRIMATAVAAAYLGDPAYTKIRTSALSNTREYFSRKLPRGLTLQDYARGMDEKNYYRNLSEIKKQYRARMTYEFPQDPRKAGQAPEIPGGAEVLLETRFPYLTALQRRGVLYSTALDSGYPLLDESAGWGRLDLVSASCGYGCFDGDVAVYMPGEMGGFHARDTWSNDIYGAGKLTKQGSGTLILRGNNSYSGGTVIEDGRLTAAGAAALGTGDLYLEKGTLSLETPGELKGIRNYTQLEGTLELRPGEEGTAGMELTGAMYINGGKVIIDASKCASLTNITIKLKAAKGITGRFETVECAGYNVKTTYTGKIITIVLSR